MPAFHRRLFQLATVLAVIGLLAFRGIPSSPQIRVVSRSIVSTAPTVLLDQPATVQQTSPVPAQSIWQSPAFVGFETWKDAYLAAPPTKRIELVTDGVALARARTSALAKLILADPETALAHAVPMVVRQEMPQAVLAQLEERISARGFFGVLGVIGQAAGEPAIGREVRLADGQSYQVHTFGARLHQTSTEHANLTGVAVGNSLALDKREFRVLEVGERLDPAKPVFTACPVSGKLVSVPLAEDSSRLPITPETPAVEIAGEIHYICDGDHIHLLAEGGTGGPTKPTTNLPNTQSTGTRTLLYMRLAFPETRREPQSEAAAYETMRQVNDFMVENSYGNLYLLTTVTPLLVLPRTEAWYNGGGGDEYALQTDAQTAARRIGYDTNQYDLEIVAYLGGPGTFSGLGYVNSKGIWIRNITAGVIAHELGHNFGLWHANSWETGGKATIGSGVNLEYGNVFDTMGFASAGDRHFNACHRALLNWLPRQTFVQQARASGTYRIHAFDQPNLDPARRYALTIVKDGSREYWAEFRQKSFNGNPWVRDGILLNWKPWADSNGGTQLLDATPGSPDGSSDASIVIGRTFSDLESGIHITPIGKGNTIPESMDVVVQLGFFPGNQTPTANIAASTLTAAPAESVTFTVTASDADGDPLSYAWDFGDRSFSSSNSSLVTKSWLMPGDYVVQCVVSDMKGHTQPVSVVVRVGSPATFKVTGTITLDGQPLANVQVSNGLTGASYLGSYSDGNGSYTITGLKPGGATVTPQLYGKTFAPTFSNPLQVSGDVINADFIAADAVSVTLFVSNGECAEGGFNPGSFTLARTGVVTEALVVNFFLPKGSAAQGLDYSISPVFASGSSYSSATIPAGQAAIEIVVTPVDDLLQEGPETVSLELAPRAGYVIAGPEAATLTILDNDSSFPVVGLRVVDGEAQEDGDAASFLVSRTGSTASALTVNFTTSGTATNAIDYSNVGGQVTIPAGSAAALVVISPLNDTSVEGTETMTLTLTSGANYFVSGVTAETAGTINIADDDTPLVTITAPDNMAGENSGDTGTFLVTRTGSTASALMVSYALSGTATHGVDYERLPGVLTIPAGANMGTITVIPINDGLGEPAQTVVVQLRGGTFYAVESPGNATISIADNTDLPVVTVGVTNGGLSEPASPGGLRFTTTGTGSGNITIHYSVTGTATPGLDYAPLTGTLSMGRNAIVDVPVLPIDDGVSEDSETVTVTLLPDSTYSLFLDTIATLNLTDDDQPLVNIAATSAAFGEGGGVGHFWISRNGSALAPLSVNYTLTGSATNGVDYNFLDDTIVIPAAAMGVSLDILAIDDSIREGAETIIASLAPGAYGIGVASATHYLVDNDAPVVQVKFNPTTGSGLESVGLTNVPVVLSSPSPIVVTVEYVIQGGTATGGVDYSALSGVLTFLPGETVKTIPLAIIDDVLNEPNETIILRLQNSTGASLPPGLLNASTYTYTITNDDALSAPTLSFASVADSGPESQATAPIVVSLSGAQASAISVHYAVTGGTATAGADYILASGTLTFAAGETARSIPNAIVNDAVSEPGETFVVTLSSPVGASIGANRTYTYTIADDDAPTLTISATDPEAGEFGSDPGIFTVNRTGSLANALTASVLVAGTATSGVDYEALPATLSLPAGAETARVEVHPLLDSIAEGDETVVAMIVPSAIFSVGPASAATVTIRDLPIDQWRFMELGPSANLTLIAGDSADPDRDEFCNLLEFTFSSDPLNPNSAAPPTFALEGSDAILTYTRPATLGDVTVSVEAWNPPDQWLPIGFTEEITENSGDFLMIKDRIPRAGAAGMILRMRVSRPAQ